jgi:hypothetical protein
LSVFSAPAFVDRNVAAAIHCVHDHASTTVFASRCASRRLQPRVPRLRSAVTCAQRRRGRGRGLGCGQLRCTKKARKLTPHILPACGSGPTVHSRSPPPPRRGRGLSAFVPCIHVCETSRPHTQA